MQNLSCLDILLTNNRYVFQQTTTACSGLLDCTKNFQMLAINYRLLTDY